MKLFIFTDGGSRGNPGNSAIGGVGFDENQKEIFRYSSFLGIHTNNFAEYSSLIFALEKSLEFGGREIFATSDSELMVKQINGIYKVRDENIKILFEKVLSLIKKFKNFKIIHKKRSEEKMPLADALVNEALDKEMRK